MDDDDEYFPSNQSRTSFMQTIGQFDGLEEVLNLEAIEVSVYVYVYKYSYLK